MMRFVCKAAAAGMFSLQISFLFSFPAAFAETIELVTYYPAPAGGGADFDRLHTKRATVGDAYNRVNVPDAGVPDGQLFVSDRLGIGTTAPASRLTVQGAGNAAATSSLNVTNSIGASLLFVQDDGNVGIGTANPLVSLHVARDGSRTISSVDTYGILGGSELWLRHARGTMAAPAAVQAGDSLGIFRFIGHTGAGGAFFPGSQIEARASANWTAGPTTTPTHLIFSTSPGAGTLERMRITDTGNVGIGDVTPLALLTVGDGDLFQVTNAGLAQLPSGTAGAPSLSYTGDTNTGFFRAAADTLAFSTNGTERMRINQNGLVGIGRVPTTNALEVNGNASKSAVGTWLGNSDVRVKTDIQDLQNALGIIGRLHPVKFRYTEAYRKQNPSVEGRYYTHFIAQEYRQVFPDSVIEGNEGYLYLDSGDAVPYLVRAAQELQAQNEALRQEVQALHQKVEMILEKRESAQ